MESHFYSPGTTDNGEQLNGRRVGNVIPPPPPLPPQRHINRQPVPPPPPLPLNAVSGSRNVSLMERKFAAAAEAQYIGETAESRLQNFYFFFYGSLMDPEVLQAVLGLDTLPLVKTGCTTGFTMKMWGIYPTLIPREGGTISGTVWKVNDQSHIVRLAQYETAAYTLRYCDVKLEDGEVLRDCRTFCWAGDPNSKELEDGSFDLERYQKYFKASVVRRRDTQS